MSILKMIAHDFGCTDNGCVFGHYGMGTNGLCHCLDGLSPKQRIRVRSGILALRKALKDAIKDLEQYKASVAQEDKHRRDREK